MVITSKSFKDFVSSRQSRLLDFFSEKLLVFFSAERTYDNDVVNYDAYNPTSQTLETPISRILSFFAQS